MRWGPLDEEIRKRRTALDEIITIRDVVERKVWLRPGTSLFVCKLCYIHFEGSTGLEFTGARCTCTPDGYTMRVLKRGPME